MLRKIQVRRASAALSLSLALFCSHLLALDSVPAWENCVSLEKAERLVDAYTSNVIRVEWAGADAKVEQLMPANLPFQFAVIGDSEVTNRVRNVLDETCKSIRPDVLAGLAKYGLVCPTLQWMVRKTRAEAKGIEYAEPNAHPAAFVEEDFDVIRLSALGKKLHFGNIPLPATVKVFYGDGKFPITKPEPGVDFPDVMSEDTFATPFGSASVFRSPDSFRRLRMRSGVFPINGVTAGFLWRSNQNRPVANWRYDRDLSPEVGYGEVLFHIPVTKRRFELFVFAKRPGGELGVPAVISFYLPPYIQRKYLSGKLHKVTYVLSDKDAMYDLSPIWIPREWEDYVEVDRHERVVSFSRVKKGVLAPDSFAGNDEKIVEAHSSGAPKTICKVEYFVSHSTNRIDYKESSGAITFRLGEYKSRDRGDY